MARFDETRYWHRVYRIVLTQGVGDDARKIIDYDSEKAIENGHEPFDIRFDIDVACGITPKFTLDIMSVGKDAMNVLTRWNIAECLSENFNLKIFAGYKKNRGAECIANGLVQTILPVGIPPDMGLHFDCIAGGNFDTAIYNPEYGNPGGSDSTVQSDETPNLESKDVGDEPEVAADKAVNAACNQIGAKKELRVNLAEMDIGDGTPTPVDCKGKTPSQIIQETSCKYNIEIATQTDREDGKTTVVVTGKNGETIERGVKEKLSAKTGLLSISCDAPDYMNASATRLLDPYLQMFDTCDVDTKFLPSFDGRFFVTGVHHSGHFRGNEWKTELKMLKIPKNEDEKPAPNGVGMQKNGEREGK